jgi:hypothetical protein
MRSSTSFAIVSLDPGFCWFDLAEDELAECVYDGRECPR